MVLKLTIEYDGANYSGWQLQPRHDSIQGRIEAALERIFAAPIRVFGSGRTDAGVHARGQVASISIPRPFEPAELQRALNSILPADIVVLDIASVPDDFDPRRAARSRVYEYRVLNRKIASAFDYRYSWLVRDQLDLSAMNRAARIFVGEHDFAAFRSLGTEVRTTIRRVISSEWTRDADVLLYRVEANSFLRH
ncbi:tRNA pseudouridine(38-40) synthase TruA, partial [Candidatus Binatus sp.]|uniref:tRNA pseudouridine(38-40) synthase TruA n=1 Tax=Candidatus Binatus sp. TaxID=2811406 RepID=UPI003CA1DAD2